jgi:hypothetical protein
MADNVEAASGSGGPTFATDDIGPGVHYPRGKLSLGADGSATDAVGGAGAVSAAVQRVTLASDDPAVTSLQLIDNVGAGTESGVLRVTIATDSTGVLSVDDNGGSLTVDNGGTFAVQATLQASTNTNEVVGDAAHDAAIAGNPVRVGGRALSADYTAVSTGDTADLITSLLGKLVTMPHALPGASWSYASPAAVTDTADDEAKAAGAAGVRHYITSIQVFNADDAVGTEVVVKDGSTVLWRGWAQETGGGCSAVFPVPLRGTAATAINVANITTSAETYFNIQGYSAIE